MNPVFSKDLCTWYGEAWRDLLKVDMGAVRTRCKILRWPFLTQNTSQRLSSRPTHATIYCQNKPDKHRYFNIADKQVLQFVKYMLTLVWGDVSPKVIFRKCKQLCLSPDTHNTVIIIFLHDKLLQVSKLPLSYVSLDSEFIRIVFLLFHIFGFRGYFIWATKAKF